MGQSEEIAHTEIRFHQKEDSSNRSTSKSFNKDWEILGVTNLWPLFPCVKLAISCHRDRPYDFRSRQGTSTVQLRWVELNHSKPDSMVCSGFLVRPTVCN